MELSFLWRWPAMDTFTHLDKVHFHVKLVLKNVCNSSDTIVNTLDCVFINFLSTHNVIS